MSVYKPDNSPFYHYDFIRGGVRFHGSTKQRTRRRAETVEGEKKREAEAALATQGAARPVTLNRATGEYWQNVAQHQASAATTEYQLENLVRLLGAATRLDDIRDAEVAAYVARRRGEPHAKYKPKPAKRGEAAAAEIPLVSPATVNREVELLARVIRRASKVQRAQLPAESERPTWRLHRLPEADPPDRPLNAEQEALLYAELVAHARPVVDTALLTGLRRQEVLTLRCENLDLQRRRGVVMRKSKKPGGERFAFEITEPLLAVLAPLVDGRTQGPVFRFGPPCACARCRKKAHHGTPITSIRTAFEGARRRAGLDGFRFHDLRHTVGSRILELTGNLKAAQTFLGHKDISTTLRYAHHAPGAMADVQRQLAAARPAHAQPGTPAPEPPATPETRTSAPEKGRKAG